MALQYYEGCRLPKPAEVSLGIELHGVCSPCQRAEHPYDFELPARATEPLPER